jgi:hypothetical protein
MRNGTPPSPSITLLATSTTGKLLGSPPTIGCAVGTACSAVRDEHAAKSESDARDAMARDAKARDDLRMVMNLGNLLDEGCFRAGVSCRSRWSIGRAPAELREIARAVHAPWMNGVPSGTAQASGSHTFLSPHAIATQQLSPPPGAVLTYTHDPSLQTWSLAQLPQLRVSPPS